MADRRKTKLITSKDEWNCPIHKLQVEKRVRKLHRLTDDEKFCGVYYACPQYSECKYYVSSDGHAPII